MILNQMIVIMLLCSLLKVPLTLIVVFLTLCLNWPTCFYHWVRHTCMCVCVCMWCVCVCVCVCVCAFTRGFTVCHIWIYNVLCLQNKKQVSYYIYIIFTSFFLFFFQSNQRSTMPNANTWERHSMVPMQRVWPQGEFFCTIIVLVLVIAIVLWDTLRYTGYWW